MKERRFKTRSVEETLALGGRIAAMLHPPLIVILRGEVGAGKTTLVKGIAAALGAAAEDEVTSPTFTIVHEYAGTSVRLFHLDLYRLAPGADAALFAWEDYLDGSSLAFVEWPEAGAAELPPADVEVVLRHRTPRSRELELRAAPAVEEALAGEMTAAGIDGVMLAPGAPPAAPGDGGDDDGDEATT